MGKDLNFKRTSKEGYMEGTMEGEKGEGDVIMLLSQK